MFFSLLLFTIRIAFEHKVASDWSAFLEYEKYIFRKYTFGKYAVRKYSFINCTIGNTLLENTLLEETGRVASLWSCNVGTEADGSNIVSESAQ